MSRFLTSLFVFAGSAVASASTAHAFNFQDLTALASKSATLEATVQNLPPEFRANYVLMHRSRSIQAGSPESPRAVLFNGDASMVISFTNEARGGDHLEIQTFNKDRFEFKTITFDGGRAIPDENPQNCFGCHGRMETDLKPVWDPGLIWRGAYGSHDDTFTDPSTIDEAEAYARFVTDAPPLYQPLDLAHRIGAGDRHVIENRPNLRLGLLLMRQQAKRVARLMGAHALKRLCAKRQTSVSPSVNQNLERFLAPIYGAAFAQDFLAQEAPSVSAALEAAAEAGVDVDEIPLTVERRTSAVFDASFPFYDLLLAEVATREGREIRTRSLIESPLRLKDSPALGEIDRVGKPIAPESIQAVCNL